MSVACYCNRCGKRIMYDQIRDETRIQMTVWRLDRPDQDFAIFKGGSERLDLCHDCSKGFELFMKKVI